MHRVFRQAKVGYEPAAMYELVRDVERYPDFLSWCRHAEVLEEGEHHQLATIHFGLPGITHSFSTRNALDPHESIKLRFERGPFKKLTGLWYFKPLEVGGCRVSLEMEYAFSNFLLDATVGRGFARIADHLVSDFCKRAGQVYD